MKIDDLIKNLQTAKKNHGNLDIYLEVNEEIDCLTCGEPKLYIYEGFGDNATAMSISGILTFCIEAKRDSDRPLTA